MPWELESAHRSGVLTTSIGLVNSFSLLGGPLALYFQLQVGILFCWDTLLTLFQRLHELPNCFA